MIHQYKLGGYNIVLDVYSGAVHVVDEVAYDIIALFEQQTREEILAAMTRKHAYISEADIAECYAQVEQLKAAGKLFAPDTFEPMAGKLKEKTAGVVKALCLHVAHTCNLNCSYCFASQGKYHGDRAVMSYEVGKQALDFLIANSGTRRNLEVDFFGGEPLMNFQVVKDLVSYARSIEKEKGKNFRFTLTTNGVLVDNAHGAYLRFLPESLHPMDLGADFCCDSAHKTLPVLTSGAYLHLSPAIEAAVGEQAKDAMMLFGSTSPSYLILQSLDGANRYLKTYPELLSDFLPLIEMLKERLSRHGFLLQGQEPLKITLSTRPYGYTGGELADLLRQSGMEPEFADGEHLVLMLTPELGEEALERIGEVLCSIAPREAIKEPMPVFRRPRQALSVREAMLAPSRKLPVAECLDRILAVPTVGCPPAVPILVCGEVIDEHAQQLLRRYGIESCCVVREGGTAWN